MAWFRGVAEQELKEEVIETPGCVFTQRHTPLGVGVAIVRLRAHLFAHS